MCSVVENQQHVSEAVHEDTLYNWHKRFGHQSYDTIEALAAKPSTGIKLTDRERPTCITYAEGKQTKNRQSRKDSGEHAPTDSVGGVICSDLKGPITPADREKKRFLVNFIDYKQVIAAYFWPGRRMKPQRNFYISWATLNEGLIAESTCCVQMEAANKKHLSFL